MKTESFTIAIGNQGQLLTQGKYLELERSSSPQETHQSCEERDSYSFHTVKATRPNSELSRKSTCTEFLVGTTLLVFCRIQLLHKVGVKPCFCH